VNSSIKRELKNRLGKRGRRAAAGKSRLGGAAVGRGEGGEKASVGQKRGGLRGQGRLEKGEKTLSLGSTEV